MRDNSLVGNLAVEYWKQRINFIDEHFKNLEGRFADIIKEYNKASSKVQSLLVQSTENNASKARSAVDEIRKLLAAFVREIGYYLEKVQFNNPPDFLNSNDDDNSNGVPSIRIETEELNKYYEEMGAYFYEDKAAIYCDRHKCNKSDEILKTFDSLNEKLPRIHRFMIQATQAQREQVFSDALDLIKQKFPEIVVQPTVEKPASQENVAQPTGAKNTFPSSSSASSSTMFKF